MQIIQKILLRGALLVVLAFSSYAQSIQVTAPNGAETVYTSRTTPITWTSSGLASTFVKLEYSVNNGSTWNLIESGANNTGTYTWTVPDAASVQCLIKVSDYGNAATFDVSNAVFTIKKPFITVTSPNGGETLTGC